MMYAVSCFTSTVNEALWLQPQKVLFSFQLWRLFTAPLITLHFPYTLYRVYPNFLRLPALLYFPGNYVCRVEKRYTLHGDVFQFYECDGMFGEVGSALAT